VPWSGATFRAGSALEQRAAQPDLGDDLVEPLGKGIHVAHA
jgi:hypothetical protein